VGILMESPLYLEMTLLERYELVQATLERLY
jgi:hypothetical protein